MDGMKVERVTSKSGDSILKFEGRLLSSALDPQREARDWVNRWRSQIVGAQRLVVLGLGSGYHLQQIVQEWPDLKVLAICCESELIEEIQGLHPQLIGRIHFVFCDNPTELLALHEIRQWMRSSFAVLEHSSVSNLNISIYNEIKQRLLAREPLFFSDWVRREPRLLKLFPLQVIPGGDEKQLLSIKELDRFVQARENSQTKDAFIVHVLRELVQ